MPTFSPDLGPFTLRSEEKFRPYIQKAMNTILYVTFLKTKLVSDSILIYHNLIPAPHNNYKYQCSIYDKGGKIGTFLMTF
jgi:hypothetical protein